MREIGHRDQNIYQCSLEFQLLDEYLSYIEESIHVTIKNITNSLREREDLIELDEGQMASLYDRFVLPDSAQLIFSRFLYNNTFLSLWVTYETSLIEIANFLSLAKKVEDFKSYKETKIKKKNVIIGLFKYFSEIQSIEISKESKIDLEHLLFIYRLRNIIAHSNGRTKDISVKKGTIEFLNWAKKQPDITVSEEGLIILNGKFCRDIFETLFRSFQTLCRLAYKEVPYNCEPRPVKVFYVHY